MFQKFLSHRLWEIDQIEDKQIYLRDTVQENKHNSLRHEGYIFTSYFFIPAQFTHTRYESIVINLMY